MERTERGRWGVGRAGESHGEKMETTVVEQQQKSKIKYFSTLEKKIIKEPPANCSLQVQSTLENISWIINSVAIYITMRWAELCYDLQESQPGVIHIFFQLFKH